MRVLLFAGLLAFSSSVLGQITIDDSDMPTAGTSYPLSSGALINDFDFSETGEDYTWDYANLESTGVTPRNYVEVGDAPFSYQFLFNNPFDQDHLADHAINTDGFDTGGGITFDEFYVFYQNDASAYTIVGYGATINSIPVAAVTDPVDNVYDFPLAFGNTGSSYSEWNVSVPTLGAYFLEQDRTYEVDGYGTLITPLGSYETLRVRTEIAAEDSIYIDLLGQSFAFERTSTEYTWLAEGEGVPVLQVTETFGQVNSITYLDEEIAENVAEVSVISPVLYPSIASEYFEIKSTTVPEKVTLYDMSGREVFTSKGQGAYVISHLSTGNYIVTIQLADNVFKQNLRIVR
ncbi:MAG: T9SS type A sorting domain-containing protein [Flavobacteriales bacterium]|nr:T9SS type A sorting domain-containing protein [Flavobacteriales bacterium]MDG1781679.1 T9SS type A sorting domain-containing protein [Flavobacteriales bacterium]MDG2244884.1 T9SS type A sorting domain-containing protein [Flavobacteriales bacterium]